MKTIKYSLLIVIFAKQPLRNPTPEWSLLVMFLYVNIELLNEQLIGKCLILSNLYTTKMSLCLCTVGDKKSRSVNKIVKRKKLQNFS